MAIFAVLLEKANQDLTTRIAVSYPTSSYQLSDTQWLIDSDAIPKTLADQLDLQNGASGRAVVIQVTKSASGWHKTSLWDWLKSRNDAS